MSKQREALDALEEIHPGNMTPMAEQAWNKAINAIREALAEPEQEPEFWPGDVLICKEDDNKVTVVHGNRGPMQLMNGKIAIAWNDNVGGEYTIEQIKEMFYRAKESEQDAPPARKPLTDAEIDNLELPPNGCTMRELVRVVERAHGIGE